MATEINDQEASDQEASDQEASDQDELLDSAEEDGSVRSESLLSSRKRSIRIRVTAWGVILAVLAGSGYLLYRTLDDASLFFYSVDRAVAQQGDLDDRRFQLHGTPMPETISQVRTEGQTLVWFALAGEAKVALIKHTGDPPNLFQPCVPVVLHGNWEDVQSQTIDQIPPENRDLLGGTTFASGYYFSSDRILVKHDNDYTLPEAESSLGQADPDNSSHGDDVLALLSGCPNQ